MMIFIHYAFLIILLGIGFGLGYWLLLAANTQEDNLQILGKTLGGILIVTAIVLAIVGFYYSTKIGNRSYMQNGYPIQGMMQQQMQNHDDEQYQEGGKLENCDTTNSEMNSDENEEYQENSSKNKKELTKYDTKDSD